MKRILLVVFLLFCIRKIVSDDEQNIYEKYVVLEDTLKNGKVHTLHAYPDLVPRMTKVDDGADVFIVHKPGVNSENDTVSLESAKFRGQFLMADSKRNRITLGPIKNGDNQKNDASLYNEHKVQTNRDIYRLFVFDYKFLCATESYPYDAYVGLDDDSTMFAKSCSFHKRAAREEESKKAEKGPVLTDEAEIQIAALSDKSFGILVEKDMKARVGQPSDKFTLRHPGFIGGEETISFESKAYPNCYLMANEKDILLKQLTETENFRKAATFVLEKYIDQPGVYMIHPYGNPDFSMGHANVAPFYVRFFLNNNTDEFDKATLWKLKSNGFPIPTPNFNIFGHPELADKDSNATLDATVHGELLKLISNPFQDNLYLEQNIPEDVLGKADLNLLANPSTIWHTLVEGHIAKVLRDNEWLHDIVIHRGEQILHSKVTEFLDWNPCSVTCGEGHQYRIAPCAYGVADCVPQQQWRTCILSACPYPKINSQETSCPGSCYRDCNPSICQMSCCSYQIKKSFTPEILIPTKKSSYKSTYNFRKRKHGLQNLKFGDKM